MWAWRGLWSVLGLGEAGGCSRFGPRFLWISTILHHFCMVAGNFRRTGPTDTGSQGGGKKTDKPDKKYVEYGDYCWLQHVRSGQHLSVRANLPSDMVAHGFMVGFAEANHATCFQIMPKYQIRKMGERIRLKDPVLAGTRHRAYRTGHQCRA